jgi:hypothetical protein
MLELLRLGHSPYKAKVRWALDLEARAPPPPQPAARGRTSRSGAA